MNHREPIGTRLNRADTLNFWSNMKSSSMSLLTSKKERESMWRWPKRSSSEIRNSVEVTTRKCWSSSNRFRPSSTTIKIYFFRVHPIWKVFNSIEFNILKNIKILLINLMIVNKKPTQRLNPYLVLFRMLFQDSILWMKTNLKCKKKEKENLRLKSNLTRTRSVFVLALSLRYQLQRISTVQSSSTSTMEKFIWWRLLSKTRLRGKDEWFVCIYFLSCFWVSKALSITSYIKFR